MASIKPSVPKGTRDFSPTEMVRRNFIFDTIKGVFRKYGYQQIETPSMENSSTLMGKYGEEGDKLILRILNNGALIDNELLRAFEALADHVKVNKFDLESYNSTFKGEEDFLRDKFIELNKDLPKDSYHKRMLE